MSPDRLKLRRMGIDSYLEPVVFMRRDCPVCRAEGFEVRSRVQINLNGRSLVALLNVVDGPLLEPGEAGLSEIAWERLGAKAGDLARFSHPPPLESFRYVRAKLYGVPFTDAAAREVMRDVADGRYSEVRIAALLSACAAERLSEGEIAAITRAMIASGETLDWGAGPVVDKHCVGGLPGNRTTLIVVPIVAAAGLRIPKTSSRSITSPAGTADTMETLAPVVLDLPAMRRVVEREGGCIVWGGAARLSPADDLLIRVERTLDIDSGGQLVASVLSKKVAAGATHVVIDIPVGPTAKVRDEAAAARLHRDLDAVGRAVGINVHCVTSDGRQPVGRGIGPALEARDVLAVLRGDADAPADLRARALTLAGRVLEFSPEIPAGTGAARAAEILADGRAWKKFQAIAQAQGGLREPPLARYREPVIAPRTGRITAIDNRRLARVAKFAGAPHDPAAGIEMRHGLGAGVARGEPLFILHADSSGELRYAQQFLEANPGIIEVTP